MVFGFFKRKVISVVSDARELRALLDTLRDDKRELEADLAETNRQIEQIEKMIETFND